MSMQQWPVPAEWDVVIGSWSDALRAEGDREATLRTRCSHLRTFARAMGGSPSELMPAGVVSWLGDQVWASATRRSYGHSLRSFFRWAEEAGIVSGLASVLPSVRHGSPVARPCPRSVIGEACRGANEDVRLLLSLGADAGLRRGEMAALSGSDACWTGDGWELHVLGKGGRRRMIPVIDSLGASVAARGKGFCFPGAVDGHWSAQWVGVQLGRVLSPWTGHSLRHRFATDMWHANHDLVIVQHMLGHSSPETTRQYIQVEADDLRRGLRAFEEYRMSGAAGRV